MENYVGIKGIKRLIGLIQGINADYVINKEELKYLRDWLNEQENYENIGQYKVIIKKIKDIIKDGVISKEEKDLILKICKDINENILNANDGFLKLLGIIEGICSDRRINEREILRLNDWLNKKQYLKGQLLFDKINNAINNILEDKMISKEEENNLLDLLDKIIITGKERLIINYLEEKIKNNENIGNNLITILDDEKLIYKIHTNSIFELIKALDKSTAINLLDTDLIFISLCLIALQHYDGNFYDYVEKEYAEIYDRYNKQRIEGTIRSIIKRYIKNEENTTRQINYILENTLVPENYLSNYFEFVYDIYKINFQFVLNENTIEDDLMFVFNGLKDTLNDTKEEVSIKVTNKTYKLIKTTKNIINNEESINELIKLTKKIIEIIDNYYWNGEAEIEGTYFRKGFEEWPDKNAEEITNPRKHSIGEKEILKSRWLPSFKLKGNDIYLRIPEHKIRKEFDYNSIKILIYSENKVIQKIEDYKVLEIMGGYRLEVPDVKLAEPLNNIRYKISAGKTLLYDSKESLYRKFILFDEDGESFLPNKNYDGNIIIAFNGDNVENTTEIYSSDSYRLFSTSVSNTTILNIADEYVAFSIENSSGVIGEICEDTYMILDNEKIRVYKNIDKVIHEISIEEKNIGVKINGKRYKLDDIKHTMKRSNGKNLIIIDCNIKESRILSMEFFDILTGKSLKNGKYKCVVDPKLSYEVIKLDKNNYRLKVESDFELMNNESDINLEDYDSFKVLLKDKNGYYDLPLQIPIYKIDNGKWHSLEDYIWIGDIKVDSYLYVKGFKAESLMITYNIVENDEHNKLTKLKIINKEGEGKVAIGNLRSYIGTNGRIFLKFTNENKISGIISCYLKCEFNDKESLISFDSENDFLELAIKIYGKGKFKIQILNENEEVILEKIFEKNSIKYRVKNLRAGKKYIIKVFELPIGFSLEQEKVLYEKQEKFYSFRSLENTRIRIVSVDFDNYDRIEKKLIRSKWNLYNTYFEILEYIGNKRFKANIYKWRGMKIYLNELNPIEVEFNTDIENESIDASAFKEGDGLLLDKANNSILNTLSDDNAPDIYEYKLKIE